MQAIKKKLKRIIKLFITYKIENDTRVYQLKYTPFTVKKSLIKKTFQQYGNTSINTKKIIFDNYIIPPTSRTTFLMPKTSAFSVVIEL